MGPLSDDDLLRHLYAREAMPSMIAFCTRVLHFSEPEAVLRIRVARASREHPVLLTELREGRLHLSGIALLGPLLTRRNRDSLLKRATHKSKEQIRELVAELAPRPDVASTMRKLPGPRAAGAPVAGPPSREPAPSLDPPAPAPSTAPLCPDTVDARNSLSGREMSRSPGTVELIDAAAPHDAGIRSDATPALPVVVARPSTPPARPATIEPLSPARYRVQFTAGSGSGSPIRFIPGAVRSSS